MVRYCNFLGAMRGEALTWQYTKNCGHYFINIKTGKPVHIYVWQKFPIAESAIEAVHALAQKDN